MQITTAELFPIPADERDLFYRLPKNEQDRIDRLRKVCFPVIIKAKTRTAGYRMAARASGYSVPTIKRTFGAWGRQGWKGLIRKYKAPAGLPEPFKQYWKALCERHQRSSKAAWRQLIRDWRAWLRGDATCAMPGYTHAPAADRKTGIPAGWGYENLINYGPNAFEQKAARQGTVAAFSHTALVFTTRVGLKVGQFIQFDDVWHDHKVNVLGQRMAQRPLEFNALDVYSAYKCAWAMKPIMENVDPNSKSKTTRLNEREMLLLTIGYLATEGYRTDTGTTLIVEHGTAAISEELEAMLLELTDGCVKINRSGIDTSEAFIGQFGGAGKGNFRMKASLESLHNLMHNEFQALPGQVGRNRDNSPAELHGRDKLNNSLLRAIAAVSESEPELAKQIVLPYVEYNQFQRFAELVYERINNRTDHQLEGWVKAGLTTTVWRPDASLPWMDQSKLTAMPDANRLATMALIESDPDLLRTRKMSPAEVWHQGRKELVKLPRSSAAMLLKDAIGKKVKVNTGGNIEFHDKDAGPEVFRFLARVKDANGRETILNSKEKFTGVMNPYFPDTLDLFDDNDRWIGSCPTIHAASKADEQGIKDAMAEAASINAKLRQPLQFRGNAILKQRLEDTERNNRMLSGGEEPQQMPFETKGRTPAAQVKATRRDADLSRAAREAAHDEDDY
jgi:hypothetical protein